MATVEELSVTVAPEASQIVLGEAIRWNVTATGGAGGYQYFYYVYQDMWTEMTKSESYTADSSFTYMPETPGNYRVNAYVKDADGTLKNAYSEFVVVIAAGGNFAYTGGVQTFTVPVSGIYKLTVVGGNGAHDFHDTAYGGYSVGYKELKKGDMLYICCGQAGAFDGNATYNGGGAGIVSTSHWGVTSGSGGGATHIAWVTGTLADIGENNVSSVLIVAGGGGGESGHDTSGAYGTYHSNGGSGGGESGGAGGESNGTFTPAAPGTQTDGYSFGAGANATEKEVRAYGNYYITFASGGGGGGLWGGHAGINQYCGGAGGSGYIGGVPSITYKGVTYTPSTSNDYNTAGTDGYAAIELVVKTTIPVIFGGTTLESIIFNGAEITSLIYNGTKLFCETWKRRIAAWFTSMSMERCLKAST